MNVLRDMNPVTQENIKNALSTVMTHADDA